MALPPLSRRVLRRLAAGERLVAVGEDWRAGKVRVSKAAVAVLRRHDLITDTGRISGPGMQYLARLSMPDAPNRIIENTANLPVHREAAMRGARQANRAEEPLAWLYARGKVSARQFEAGERLRRDNLVAAQGAKVTMSWDVGPASRTRRGAPEAPDPTLTQVAAKQRFEAALDAAGGGLRDVLTRTVCMGEGLETAERAMGWPARAGKVVLGLGLDRVADYYRV